VRCASGVLARQWLLGAESPVPSWVIIFSVHELAMEQVFPPRVVFWGVSPANHHSTIATYSSITVI
jgi:hypothetical protein